MGAIGVGVGIIGVRERECPVVPTGKTYVAVFDVLSGAPSRRLVAMRYLDGVYQGTLDEKLATAFGSGTTDMNVAAIVDTVTHPDPDPPTYVVMFTGANGTRIYTWDLGAGTLVWVAVPVAVTQIGKLYVSESAGGAFFSYNQPFSGGAFKIGFCPMGTTTAAGLSLDLYPMTGAASQATGAHMFIAFSDTLFATLRSGGTGFILSNGSSVDWTGEPGTFIAGTRFGRPLSAGYALRVQHSGLVSMSTGGVESFVAFWPVAPDSAVFGRVIHEAPNGDYVTSYFVSGWPSAKTLRIALSATSEPSDPICAAPAFESGAGAYGATGYMLPVD